MVFVHNYNVRMEFYQWSVFFRQNFRYLRENFVFKMTTKKYVDFCIFPDFSNFSDYLLEPRGMKEVMLHVFLRNEYANQGTDEPMQEDEPSLMSKYLFLWQYNDKNVKNNKYIYQSLDKKEIRGNEPLG